MKVIILIVGFCCVTLLPSTIQNDDEERIQRLEAEFDKLKRRLDGIAQLDEPGFLINGIFRLSYNGFLDSGDFALTYKGTIARYRHRGTEVAMKFTLPERKVDADKEYQMYTYLKAIDKPVVELNGIPTVYYYGPCDQYMLMALTLLKPTLNQKYEDFQTCDILFLFREFIIISKYMHSCGVRHDDIKPGNLMFRRDRAFIIDYKSASKMYEYSGGGTPSYLPRRVPVKVDGPSQTENVLVLNRYAKDDWESFLYSMCEIIDYDLGWFENNDPKDVYDLKKNTTNTLIKIENMENTDYRQIFSHFAYYVLDDKQLGFPDYDEFYGYFDRMIPEPYIASWLTKEEKWEAMQNTYERNISDITDPSQVVVDGEFYPKPNDTYFTDIYRSYGGSSILFD